MFYDSSAEAEFLVRHSNIDDRYERLAKGAALFNLKGLKRDFHDSTTTRKLLNLVRFEIGLVAEKYL